MFTRCLNLLFFILIACSSKGQIILSGTVYDSTRIYSVSGVKVIATSGAITFSDSTGGYSIPVNFTDSVYFFFRDKPTTRFAVRSIKNTDAFDISLKINQRERYKPLQEVIVYSKPYRQDSLENRLTYARSFNFTKPTIATVTPTTPGAAVGFDLDQLIGMFRFRRNKLNLLFQKTLVELEHDKYVRYRFNNLLIKRITGLAATDLENYKKLYEPSYEFITQSSQVEFYQYILQTAEVYKANKNKAINN
ncbi:hypothetical protein BH09BAC2_BH09BAC2_03550 [soil metagenome]